MWLKLIPNACPRVIKLNTLAELRAEELGYGVLDVESRFSVEEYVACSCFRRVGRLVALQLAFKPTSKSINATDGQHQHKGERTPSEMLGSESQTQLHCEIKQEIKVKD